MSDIRVQSNSATTNANGITVNTPYEDKESMGVSVDDFLNLMIAQMQNQDPLDPMDDAQYVTQLAQFATMQSMQEMNYYSQTAYVTNLVGKTVTAATNSLTGVKSETGVVTKVTLTDGEYLLTVNGKQFNMKQIMTVNDTSTVSQDDLDVTSKMALITQNVTKDSISIRWESPVSGEEADELTYSVYYTDDSSIDFNDVNAVKSKGTLAADKLTDLSYEINNLDPDKTYFVNVVVRDAAGKESVYQRSIITTKSE